MVRLLQCRYCGKEYEAKRNDSKFCSECRAKRIREGLTLTCPLCGQYKCSIAKHCQSCENKLRAKKGDKSWNWKGGRVKAQDGHIVVLKPEGYKDYKHRYIYEHRVIWEKAHGKLPKGYVIHHLNGIPDDNRLENLVALSRGAHSGSTVLNAFKTRIRQLESQLKEFKTASQQELELPA